MTACLPDLILRISCDDEAAFAEVYRLYKERLFRFSYSITRCSHSAEETVEDVFINIWCNRKTLPGVRDLTVYLYTAVKNRSLNVLSRKSYALVTAPFEFLNIELQPLSTNPYEILITREMMQQMQHAIDALPARCKMIFKLVREDGLQYKEVAEILNISVKTIDAQMAIAVKRICAALNVSPKDKKSVRAKLRFTI